MEQSRWNQVCTGDDPSAEHEHPFGGGHGPAGLCGRNQHHKVHEDPSPLPQRNHSIRVQEGCPHISSHHQAGEDADPRAAGRPSQLRRLHPLVPPRAT